MGSVLYLTATVAYTEQRAIGSARKSPADNTGVYTRVQIRVDSKVRNIEHGETKPTGQFNYTFDVEVRAEFSLESNMQNF